MKLDLAEEARADLLDLAESSRRRWGATRTSRYVADLRMRLRRLARGELSGTAVAGKPVGLRRIPSGTHVIFFRIEGDRLQVVRILHQSQDPGRRLP